ncbi:MAG: lipopolysaccharide biosynthesis protein [Roseiflexus castenholzii]|uniref:lipopolysaccharide biosynthesis protein n=1 Tax=Roseiflexus castenholzii TaxID=120962 RepID=UPI000CC1A68B|nr:MAG: lipopolysaccharide biosynthesis protein [Roseiflexus castenholzii]
MQSTTTSQSEGVGKRAVRGTFWSFLSYTSGRLVTFVTTLILARLLAPAEFGVIAYCTLVIAYLDLLNNFGVGHALIARRDRLEEAQNAAFVVSIGSSVFLYAGAWIAAPSIAVFFNEPQVTPLLRVLSLGLLLVGIGTVPMAMLQRDLRFKAYLLPGIVRNIIKAVVAISMAWQGFGVWSLVVSELVNKVLEVIIPWLIVRWRPTRAFDPQVMREMLGYGVHIMGVSLVGSFMVNVDYLLVGRLLGAAALGYYTMAFRIPELVIRSVSQIVSTVAFPVLAHTQSDPAKTHDMYFAYLRYMALVTFPAGVGLALLSPALVQVFFAEVWRPMTAPMQFIAIASAFSIVSYLSGIIYNAIGRPDLTFKLSLAKLPIVVLVLSIGTFWNITGVAAGHVALTLVCMALDLVMIRRVTGVRLMGVWHAVRPALLGAGAMAAVVGALDSMLTGAPIVQLAALPPIGALVYLGTIWIAGREMFLEARSVLRGSLARG